MDEQPTVGAVIEQIAPRVRRARERKDVSLADLARATGISTSTLSRLESAQRKPSALHRGLIRAHTKQFRGAIGNRRTAVSAVLRDVRYR